MTATDAKHSGVKLADDGRNSGKFANALVDRAAGGVVAHGGKVLLVHRPRYDDWSLPKGHLRRGETWEQGALREVAEETGVDAIVIGEAVPVTYLVGHNLPKVVMFFPMAPAGLAAEGRTVEVSVDGDEVDEAVWMELAPARQQLSYLFEVRALDELWPVAAAGR